MKNIKFKTITFISTLGLGVLIAGNFNFKGFNDSLKLNTKEYQEAVETKNRLLKEVGSLKSDNIKYQEKISKYTSKDQSSDKVLQDMKYELSKYSMIAGMNEVSGQGIVIIINDGVFDNEMDSERELKKKTLHDSDMFSILNELKSVGAEAISINEHRISPLSALTCKYAFLEFDDGDMVAAPFNIYAIGDAKSMKAMLLEEGSYLRRLEIRGLSVTLEVKDNITMKAANVQKIKDAKEYIKK
ncbi:MAG: DUF881 domain-containing protein [Clostridium sp.]|jgi:uncharacterized protein YlxW (UPF0749 family)|nr:DUF881 domain-containing protein [Clostridium sp.]